MQVRECDDNYLKSCYIAYEKAAKKVPLRICKRPLVKDCSGAKVGGANTDRDLINYKNVGKS
jgi:hypothetical protein